MSQILFSSRDERPASVPKNGTFFEKRIKSPKSPTFPTGIFSNHKIIQNQRVHINTSDCANNQLIPAIQSSQRELHTKLWPMHL